MTYLRMSGLVTKYPFIIPHVVLGFVKFQIHFQCHFHSHYWTSVQESKSSTSACKKNNNILT
jgi:hypothetical protein